MKNRNKVIAGVGGVALIAGLAGMGTFALWSDDAAVDAGIVTAGNLEVEEYDTSWSDVSADIQERGIPSIASYKVSPGDTLRLKTELDVALDGANLAANVDISTLTDGIVQAGAEEYVTTDFVVRDAAGTVLTPEADGSYRFSADNSAEELGGVAVPATIDDTADLSVEVTISFDENAPDRVLVTDQLVDFENSGVSLTQVREGQGFTDVEEGIN